MAKRNRDGIIKRPLKRATEHKSHENNKKMRIYEYWHHKELNREERASKMAEMYIHLLNIKNPNSV